jgi:hypothetical protein
MTRRCRPIYVLAMRRCTSVKGTEMTFRKPAGRGPWYLVGWRS